jgi:hypothetical protein
MTNWFITTLENSKVKALLLEVRWDFEASRLDRLARILIGAQVLRLTRIELDPDMRPVVHDPLAHDRARLVKAYSIFEEVRNVTAAYAKEEERQTARMGMAMPEFVRQRVQEQRRSLEIWMATIGSAIAKAGGEQGALIWGRLKEARAQVPEALRQLRTLEQETGATLFDVSNEQIVEACSFVPAPYK